MSSTDSVGNEITGITEDRRQKQEICGGDV